MNEKEFFSGIVEPTVKDFSNNPGNRRLGILACLILQSMTEHYYYNITSINELGHNKIDNDDYVKGLRDFKTKLSQDNFAIKTIAKIANGSKHVKGDFFNLNETPPNAIDVCRCSFPISSEPYTFVDQDRAWLLCHLTDHVADYWREKIQTN